MELKELNNDDLLLVNGGGAREVGEAIGWFIGASVATVLVAVHIVADRIVS